MEYYTVEETAKILKVTRCAVYRWRKQGLIHANRIGRKLLFEKAEIERAVKRENSEVKR